MITISLTVLLSFTGLSYAYWSNTINISTTAGMANMDVHFVKDNDTLSYFTDSTVSDCRDNVVEMNLTLKRGDSISKTFSVENAGTIPVRLKDSGVNGSSIVVYTSTKQVFSDVSGLDSTSKGVKITVSPFVTNPISPQEKTEYGKITISINNVTNPSDSYYVPLGQYTFITTLYYYQWTSFTSDFTTGTYGSWKKKILIRGTIDVV